MKNIRNTRHHTFRTDKDTQQILENLLKELDLNKSELLRECIRNYNDSLCKTG